jgi:hypothetical protein
MIIFLDYVNPNFTIEFTLEKHLASILLLADLASEIPVDSVLFKAAK